MDAFSQDHPYGHSRYPRTSAPALAIAVLTAASIGCSDATRDPLEPHGPSLARAARSASAGFSDGFDGFNLSRWSKEEHALGLGFFRIENVLVGGGTVSLVSPAGSYDGGEIRSVDQFGYGTYTVSLKTPYAPGSISAFFLYQGRYQSDEIDIELYNDDTRRVLLTTWVRGRLTNHVSMTLPFDPSSGYHEYTIDWSSSRVRFYADGQKIAEFASKVPRNAMYLMANAWWPVWLTGDRPSSDVATVIDWITAAPR